MLLSVLSAMLDIYTAVQIRRQSAGCAGARTRRVGGVAARAGVNLG
jgi:hypothetical protein